MKIRKYRTCVIESCRKEEATCRNITGCSAVEAERELLAESLKSHLSEQRHDFFNLLQVLYGYTQLKKTDKVLANIKDYCRQMENIGRLYNRKCIKLADLLYNKDKEAESIDLDLQVCVETSFDPVVRTLEAEAVLNAVDYAISSYMYVLDGKGYKNAHIIYELKEYDESFSMEIYCRDIKEGQLEAVSFDVPQQAMHWKKIERNVMCFDTIVKHCRDNGFDAGMLEDGVTFALSIGKPIKE